MNRKVIEDTISWMKHPICGDNGMAMFSRTQYYQIIEAVSQIQRENADMKIAIDKAATELERMSMGCPRDTYPEFNTKRGCCIGYPLRDERECWKEWILDCRGQSENQGAV